MNKSTIKKLVAALVVLSLFTLANLYYSEVKLSALLTKVEMTEQIAENTNSAYRINATQGVNGGCIRLGVIGREYCGINEWDKLVSEVIRPQIIEGKDELQSERYFLEKISLWPFGGEFEEAKAAYVKHIDSWIDFYERTGSCKTYDCLISRWNQPSDINSTFLISSRLFREVIPMFDFRDAKGRIEEVFKS